MKTEKKKKHAAKGRAVPGADGGPGEILLARFRCSMPAEVARFSDVTVEWAFRRLYAALEAKEPVIGTGDIADEMVRSMRDDGVEAMPSLRDGFAALCEAIMAFLAESFGYRREGVESLRPEMARIFWPHVARLPGAAGAMAQLVDAVIEYYDGRSQISTAEAAEIILGKYPGIIDEETLNAALNEIFDMICGEGHMVPY
ncbi:MAG: hypothetical protein JW838_15755 [Spirochaetes bacterium]|nr:hypothetical protein [Spirochaetota bacterium]